jgi:hypothetical protein
MERVSDTAGSGLEFIKKLRPEHKVDVVKKIHEHNIRFARVNVKDVSLYETDLICHAVGFCALFRFLKTLGVEIDTNAAVAPNFLTAITTVRPSPQPRSYTTSPLPTLATLSMAWITGGGVGS